MLHSAIGLVVAGRAARTCNAQRCVPDWRWSCPAPSSSAVFRARGVQGAQRPKGWSFSGAKLLERARRQAAGRANASAITAT